MRKRGREIKRVKREIIHKTSCCFLYIRKINGQKKRESKTVKERKEKKRKKKGKIR